MRALVTAAFEVLGILLLTVAIAMALWPVYPPAAIAAAALVLLAASWVLDWVANRGEEES